MKCPRGILPCAVATLILALVVFAGCVSQPRPEGYPQSGQYAFLDHEISYTGTLVNGTCPAPAIRVTPYIFDEENKTLAGIVPFETNDSLLLVYGRDVTLSGGYGTGGYGTLGGAYVLPYTGEDLTVEGFTKNGTMYIGYRNQTLALDPGTQWIDISTGTETTSACTLNRTVTDVITYYGNYPRSGIAKTRLA